MHHTFGQPGGTVPDPANAEHIVTRVLDDFLSAHGEGGGVLLPRCRLKLASGKSGTTRVYPAVETVLTMTDALVACRVQMPFAPSAVRTASAVLSATLRVRRVVVHCPRVGDVLQAHDSHAAPLYVALTRVPNISSVALTLETEWHDNIAEARAPFRDLAAHVQGWDKGQGYCRMYHCQSRGYDGHVSTPQGSAEHDAVHDQQVAMEFFDV